MNIRIIALSDSDKHFSTAIAEYSKRLGKSVELVDLKPVKNGTNQQIIAKETELIKDKIQTDKNKGRTIVLLSKEWKLMTTEQFSGLLQKHSLVTFVIGWPYGLDEPQLKTYVDYTISFGSHTMPHGLAKLVLLEQVYRSTMLVSGKSYHY